MCAVGAQSGLTTEGRRNAGGAVLHACFVLADGQLYGCVARLTSPIKETIHYELVPVRLPAVDPVAQM